MPDLTCSATAHPTTPPAVSVIIVNWNGRRWLESCLSALQTQTYEDFEVIVVDNGSTDDSLPWLRNTWAGVQVLAQELNLGFAAANNLAICMAVGHHVIALNNDTRPDPEWIESLVEAAADPGVGMVASQIVKWTEPDILDSAGIEVDRAGIAWNRGWAQPSSTAAEACEVFGPSAAAALYRREMLDEIGLFDEDFFMYYEDVDIAWRAQRAGWRCRYQPSARVLHWHSATAQKSPQFKTFHIGRNKIWTIFKNYDWPDLLWALPIVVLYDVLAIGYHCIHTRNLAALRGRLSALPAWRRMVGKRKPRRKVAPLIPPRLPWRIALSSASERLID
jgi:GT2 family glycosyltransferase